MTVFHGDPVDVHDHYLDVHDLHKGADQASADGVVLGESSCKSIPADDSLLRTAGSTGAILSKQI